MANPPPGIRFTPKRSGDTYSFIDPTKVSFKGRYVTVSGASGGMGKATAISYAKAGVSGLALLARSDLSAVEKDVLEAASSYGHPAPKVLTIKTDVTSRDDCEAAAKKIEDHFGRLDILVNNAGYLETWKKFAETDPDDWWKTFEINVKGCYLMTRSFLPLLLKSGGDKTVIQITSAGALVTVPGASAYQTSKTTVCRLNDFLMAEYGSEGLLAFAVHPGTVATELAKGMPKEFLESLPTSTPQLCGDTLVWLTSERREWLADRYVSAEWNMEELLAKKDDIVDQDLLKIRIRV